jgi:hypothetical protein
LVTPGSQPAAPHWYHCESERDWTQVRGGTDLPSVADEHQAQLLVHECWPATQEPFSQVYQAASVCDCTQVPAATDLSSVAELQLD